MQDVTERARELRDAGASFSVIAATLNAEGYRGGKGGLWSSGSVFRLLQPPRPKNPGHHTPHTEESKRKMSESHKKAFAEGRRASQKGSTRKTHCPKGHPYDEENTYYPVDGGRQCKTCSRAATRERRKRLREANPPAPRVLEKPAGEMDYRMGSPGRRPYGTMHLRLRSARGPANRQKCVHCAERGVDKRAYDWAKLRERDGKDVMDYVPLCRKCHVAFDNPDGAGDKAIGQRRAEQQRAKTHCPHGHEYTPENTYVINRTGGRTARQCRTCMREQRDARRKGA
jgi:hypothetical protein